MSKMQNQKTYVLRLYNQSLMIFMPFFHTTKNISLVLGSLFYKLRPTFFQFNNNYQLFFIVICSVTAYLVTRVNVGNRTVFYYKLKRYAELHDYGKPPQESWS